MFDKSKNGKDDIFRAESILSSDHVPEQLPARKSEAQEIANTLKPLVRRDPPEHLLLHGPAGVGKSTVVNHVFDKLSDETSVTTIDINCWQYNTRPSVLTEALIQLGYPAPRKGKPVDELCSKLREWLDKNQNVAIALDEFDKLTGKTEVLYDIARLNRQAKYHIGTVMISNVSVEELDLDPRTESRISCRALRFDPYSKDELMEILSQRAEQAFAPGAISDDVLETIAEWAMTEHGDCRRALETLLQIGRQAVRDARSKITMQYLHEIDMNSTGVDHSTFHI